MISPILRVYLVYLVVFACDISNITSVSRLFCRVRMWYLQYYECISFILSCSHVISPILRVYLVILSCSHVISPILRVYLVYFVVFACDISNITSVSRLFSRVRMWYLQYYECISFILSCSHVISPILRVCLSVRMWYLQYYECISFI